MMSGRLRSVAAQWKSIAREAVDRTLLVAKFLCFLHVTNTYVCTPCLVHGPSMLPTLNLTGDVILVERISTCLEKVAPGDIVLVRSPENPRKLVTKRVLGMEGDRVTFVVDPKISDRYESVNVPKGHVWVQGDNIYASHDSRQFGPVPYGLLLGKAFYRIWPPDGFGSLGRGE
ncbi:mitochondrial inner membrane protease subunit 1-like [Telopea speciosissima]|uniref:mitochondrial inner membrane protease subunit 1-like n=1 Tax=Telopea speciosissima TaxID=54955 RepID=UPI001CC53725|nr:mitochondrial inner membrane protease subunit 1-like [Telopea speciosissima]